MVSRKRQRHRELREERRRLDAATLEPPAAFHEFWRHLRLGGRAEWWNEGQRGLFPGIPPFLGWLAGLLTFLGFGTRRRS